MTGYIFLICWLFGALYLYPIASKVSDKKRGKLIETYSQYLPDNELRFVPILLDAIVIGIVLLWPIVVPVTMIDIKIEERKKNK